MYFAFDDCPDFHAARGAPAIAAHFAFRSFSSGWRKTVIENSFPIQAFSFPDMLSPLRLMAISWFSSAKVLSSFL